MRETHTYPLTSDGKDSSGNIKSVRLPARLAWRRPSLEIRSATAFTALTLDLDYSGSYEALCGLVLDRVVPWPNIAVERLSNGHAHASYFLAAPVLRAMGAKLKPLQVLSRISEYYREALGADPGYNAVLTHNPMIRAHPKGTMQAYWITRKSYSLASLRAFIPKGWRKPAIPSTAIGRHTGLKEAGCKWAGSPLNQGKPVMPMLWALNLSFEFPLSQYEVASLARWIEQMRDKWNYYSPEKKTLWGQRLGVASGKSRREATQERDETILMLAAQGWSQRAIAKDFGMTQQAVNKILNRASAVPIPF